MEGQGTVLSVDLLVISWENVAAGRPKLAGCWRGQARRSSGAAGQGDWGSSVLINGYIITTRWYGIYKNYIHIWDYNKYRFCIITIY